MNLEQITDALVRAIKHAPAYGGNTPLGLTGGRLHEEGEPYRNVFICARCAARIVARGCTFPVSGDALQAIWVVVGDPCVTHYLTARC